MAHSKTAMFQYKLEEIDTLIKEKITGKRRYDIKKMKVKFLILAFVMLYNTSSGQSYFSITGGLDFPEFINVGVKYRIQQVQAGVAYGFWPFILNEKMRVYSGDAYYHFGKFSDASELRPWFGRLGIIYLEHESWFAVDKYFFIHTRIGRDFAISDKMGFSLDAGIVFELTNDEKVNHFSVGWLLNLDYPVLPSLGIRWYYRL